MMKAQPVHALRACSLVAIPLSEERTPPPGGFPRDTSGMNLTSWAGLIQDVAQGMKVVPPNLSMEVCLDSMVLLQLLEATTGIGYCRICCQPSPQCCCLGAYQPASTETWSQMMARIPGQGVAASIGGPTTPGTATAEVQEQGAPSPPPGLHPPDFTNWSLPLPEAPLTGGLPAPSGGPPGIGKQTVGPWAPGPQAPGQRALALPMQAPSTPQEMLLVHQPRRCHPATPYQQVVQPLSQPATSYQQAVQPLSQPATPYQQAVQLPRRQAGRGGAAQPPSNRATPAAGQTIPNHRRPQARGRGIRGRSVSHPGHGRGMATNVPSTTTPGATQPQPDHRARPRCSDPAILASKYCSGGWRKDLEHVLKVYYQHSIQAPFREPEWVRVRELFFDRFVPKKAEVPAIKEESPLEYMPFIAEEFYRATGLRLHGLPEFTLWIKKGCYFHALLVKRGQVQECPHLIGALLPRWPQLKPSESHQESYRRAEGPTVGSSEPSVGATTAPTQETPTEEPPVGETPAEEPPVEEAPVAGPSRSNAPALMEMGGVGDGQSWAEQVETSSEAEFRWARPLKCPRSQSRRWEMEPALPFPLQDMEGRLASTTRLYEHAGEQRLPQDDVAGQAIRHLHPEILPRDAR